jgi:hypothetical protein
METETGCPGFRVAQRLERLPQRDRPQDTTVADSESRCSSALRGGTPAFGSRSPRLSSSNYSIANCGPNRVRKTKKKTKKIPVPPIAHLGERHESAPRPSSRERGNTECMCGQGGPKVVANLAVIRVDSRHSWFRKNAAWEVINGSACPSSAPPTESSSARPESAARTARRRHIDEPGC